ncbi:MAG: sortase [Armatimonadetes bacterium]|nr:sortase [Anaerolineae bacterium]
MVRRQRNPFANLFTLILLGALAGVVFIVYDQVRTSNAPAPLVSPTVVVAAVLPTLTPTVMPTAIPTNSAGIVQLAQLSIPRLGVFAPIIQVYLDEQSWDVSQLGRNVGYLQGTGWLDQAQPGNVVLSGHVELRNGETAVFAALKQLAIGDQIIVLYKNTERIYTVTQSTTVDPDDLTPLYPTENEQLTLITCDAFDFFQNAYQKRIVVVAERVS